MADIKSKYGANNQAITITLNGQTTGVTKESVFVSNAVDLFLDVLVQLKIDTGNVGAPSGAKNVLVYVAGSVDDGVTYSGGARGINAVYGGADGQLIDNCIPLGIVSVDAQNEVFTSDVFSIASAFGGVVPEKWAIIVKNQTGQTFAANSGVFYQGVYAQSS